MRWLKIASTSNAIANLFAHHGLAPALAPRTHAPPKAQMLFAFTWT